MRRVEEIEEAIQRLSREEFAELARWVLEAEQKLWDKQLDEDTAAGRLDFLRDEALAEKGQLKDWP